VTRAGKGSPTRMTMHETRVEPPDRSSDVEHPAQDVWDSTIDLGRFERLSEAERRRIIIRVLCGLVAMEEVPEPAREPWPAPVAAPTPVTTSTPVASPTPGPAARLPFLGLETAAYKRPPRSRGWTTALLPHLGPERPF